MLKRFAFGRRQAASLEPPSETAPQRAETAARPSVGTAPLRPHVDSDGVRRALPKALWEGKHGDMLRGLGMSPDDPTNLMPTSEGIKARLEALREEQENFIARVNANLPFDIRVLPWAMLPHGLWAREHGGFLLAMEFYAVDPWNTMLLGADQVSALSLGLPEHPRGVPKELEDAANKVIGGLRAKLDEAHKRTTQALARNEISALDDFANAHAEARRELVKVAFYFGVTLFGEKVFERHRQLFAATLGWVPPPK